MLRSKTFMLEDTDVEKVGEIAQAEDISLSAVARRAIQDYYTRWEYDTKQNL